MKKHKQLTMRKSTFNKNWVCHLHTSLHLSHNQCFSNPLQFEQSKLSLWWWAQDYDHNHINYKESYSQTSNSWGMNRARGSKGWHRCPAHVQIKSHLINFKLCLCMSRAYNSPHLVVHRLTQIWVILLRCAFRNMKTQMRS